MNPSDDKHLLICLQQNIKELIPSALSCNTTLSTIHRNLFMVTIPPMVVCGLRFSTITTGALGIFL